MGAEVTGVDFSDAAIAKARSLTTDLSLEARFVECDIYSLKEHLEERFDIVFTSYGAIGWLPDLKRWAEIVSHVVKPGGRFVMAEFHPMVWMFDERFTSIDYAYFNRGPIVEHCTGTYADEHAPISYLQAGWNHPISDVLQSLLDAGLRLEQFREWDYSPWGCFSAAVEDERGIFRIKHLKGKIPMVYGLVAGKA